MHEKKNILNKNDKELLKLEIREIRRRGGKEAEFKRKLLHVGQSHPLIPFHHPIQVIHSNGTAGEIREKWRSEV